MQQPPEPRDNHAIDNHPGRRSQWLFATKSLSPQPSPKNFSPVTPQ
jgi:hypothetical protein